MIYRILHNFLIICVVLGFQNNFFTSRGMTSANFHYETLNTLVTPNIPYNQISIQDSMTSVVLNLQNIINNSISQNVLNNNLLPVGDIGYIVTASIILCIQSDTEYYGTQSFECTSDKCIKANDLINNNGSTPLFSTFQKTKIGGYCISGDTYGAIIFDTRSNNWTNQNTSDAVSFILDEVLTIITPFTTATSIFAVFEAKNDDSILALVSTKACFDCNASGGASFNAFNVGSPFRGDVYDNAPLRLIMLILLYLVNLYEIWLEFEDYTISTKQTRSNYWSNSWNRLDWFIQFFFFIVIPLSWIVLGEISGKGFGYQPVYILQEWTDRAAQKGLGIPVWLISYGLCFIFFINLIRFFKSFRYHISLRIYLRFLKELGEMIGGFVSFFLVLAIQFALLFYILTSVCGFNNSFVTLDDSFNEILQVTFGFVDYDSFTNNNFGLGYATIFVKTFFYIAVIIFTVIIQNIILAIVGNAYDVARRPENSSRNIIGLLIRLILFHVITAVPIALFSLYYLLKRQYSQRVNGAVRVLSFMDSFMKNDQLWMKYSAFVRYDSLLKCLSFVYVDCQSDELKITHGKSETHGKSKILNFKKLTRVSVNLELIGRAPWIDEDDTLKEEFAEIARVSKGVGTIESVDSKNNTIVLTFENSVSYNNRVNLSLDTLNIKSSTSGNKTYSFSVFSDTVLPKPEEVLTDLSNKIFPSPSSAFNIFNETLNTEKELVRLFEVAGEVIDNEHSSLLHPISRMPLFEKPEGGIIGQAAYEFFQLFVESEMNSYKVYESNIEQSRSNTSVFEIVDDGIDSKRRFEQMYTGGFRNSILSQKLDETVSDNRINKNLCDIITSQKDEIIDLRKQIEQLKK